MWKWVLLFKVILQYIWQENIQETKLYLATYTYVHLTSTSNDSFTTMQNCKATWGEVEKKVLQGLSQSRNVDCAAPSTDIKETWEGVFLSVLWRHHAVKNKNKFKSPD